MGKGVLGFVLLTGLYASVSGSLARAESPNDLLVIANKSVTVSSASTAELRTVFLKKRRNLSGVNVLPINCSSTDSARKVFRQKVLGMNEAQEAKYWEDEKIKSGKTKPPEIGAILKAVYKLKNSVGYVFRKDYKPGLVKVLATL